MKKRILLTTSFSVGVVGLMALPSQAGAQETSAQEPGAPALEEVVVTARKREESLMVVPMSISALTANSIEETDIKNANQLAPYTPGMYVEAIGTNRALTFRGLSVSNGGQVFIDGAPYVGQFDPDLGSLERVEVLLGPQSAYFGRSTFTGALNYVLKDPSMKDFKGTINLEYGSYNKNDESLMLEGPIVPDILSLRINARHYSIDGQWTNNSEPGNNPGWVKKDTASAVAVATPSDELKAKLFLSWGEDEGGLPDQVALKGFNYAGAQGGQYESRQLYCNRGGTDGPYWCGPLPSAGNLGSLQQAGTPNIISFYNIYNPTIYNALINDPTHKFPTLFDPHRLTHFGYIQDAYAAHFSLTYTFADGYELSSISALHYTQAQNNSQTNFRDSSVVPDTSPTRILPWIGYYFLGQSENLDASQELRITSPQDQSIRWTLGANYLYTYTPGNLNVSVQPAGLGISGSITEGITNTPAVFGGAYYDITDELTFGAEVRYQWDTIDARARFPTPATNLNQTYTSFSPRVTLDYKIDDNGVLYALWSRGFRPGGFNSGIVGLSSAVLQQLGSLNANIAYEQEQMDNFEVGIKNTFLDGRLRTAFGGYYDQWRNGQVTNTISINTPTQVQQVSVIQNVGAVDLDGIEFTGAFAATKNLTITGNANYVHSVILDYDYNPNGPRIIGTTNVNGNTYPNAPVGWTFALSPEYTDDLVGDWQWFARVDWKHRGRYYADASNLAWIPSNDTVDLHLGVKDEDMTFEVYALNANRNLNFVAASYGVDSTCCLGASNINEVRLTLPDQRQFGVKGKYSFGLATAEAPETAAYTPPPVVTAAPASVARSYMVFFDFNKSDLTPQAVGIVGQAAHNAAPAHVTQLMVTGHTDTVGSDAYNMRLSRRRAESVAAELEKDGVPSGEIEIVAKGKHDLLVPTSDGVREPQNRRVQIVYSDGASS